LEAPEKKMSKTEEEAWDLLKEHYAKIKDLAIELQREEKIVRMISQTLWIPFLEETRKREKLEKEVAYLRTELEKREE